MVSKGILSIIALSLIVLLTPIAAYSESKSIEAIVTLQPYGNDRMEIHVKFLDVIGQTIKHVNYDISARHNNVSMLEDTGVHIHDGQGTHITAPLEISPNSNDAIEIEIIFGGIGTSKPYGGPVGKVFQITGYPNSPRDTPLHADTTAPLLLVPQDIVVQTSNPDGIMVDYSVKAIDDVDGVIEPRCQPQSGSFFSTGITIVTCNAVDDANNSEQKSFAVKVRYAKNSQVPDWVRDVAGFWCHDEIDDSGFVESIRYLVANNVIVLPPTESEFEELEHIPSWIKANACWWSDGQISDEDFVKGLQFLIRNGIIGL